MRRIICIMLIICLLPVSTQALYLVESDYDKDKWCIEHISFEPVDTIPEGWYPLKAVSEYLPIDVSWDEEKREIIVVSHDLQWKNKAMCTFRYKADNLPIEMKIKDGVTYCNARILSSYLRQRGFLYKGEVYFFSGEDKISYLIRTEDKLVKARTISTMFEIKLKMPEEYKFIRKHINGGISYVSEESIPSWVTKSAMGYVYPYKAKPICYVIGTNKYKGLLVNIISHEAYHVYEYRTRGYTDEIESTKYGIKVQNDLAKIQ